MKRLALIPLSVMAFATACADQEMTAPLKAPGGRRLTVSPTPERTFAYVANSGSDNVSVIRTSDNSVVATIAVGDEPRELAITPSAGRVYVTNFSSDNVSVIRTSDNVVVATVPVGHHPQDVAAAPDGGRVYVVNSDDGTVSVLRTSDNTVVATIDVGDAASSMAITPDGSEIYVTGSVTSPSVPPFPDLTTVSTSVIRTSDYSTRGAITWGFGSTPVDVAFNPDGSRVYFPGTSAFPPNATLQVFQASDLTAVSSLTLPGLFGPIAIAMSPSGSEAYVVQPGLAGFFGGTCTPGGVSIIPTATNSIAATVPVSCFPLRVAFTPDGSRAFVTTRLQDETGSVALIGTSARAVVGSVAVGTSPFGIAIAFVPTPSQLLVALRDRVSALDLPSGVAGSLLAKLNSASTAIEAGKIRGACGALQDFVSQVAAQSGKKISSADAAQLISMANQLRELIGC